MHNRRGGRVQWCPSRGGAGETAIMPRSASCARLCGSPSGSMWVMAHSYPGVALRPRLRYSPPPAGILRWMLLVTRTWHSVRGARGREVSPAQIVQSISENVPLPFSPLARQERDVVDGSSQSTTSGSANSASGGAFIPLTVAHCEAALEIVHPVGYRVCVTGQVDNATLQQVFDVLDERGQR